MATISATADITVVEAPLVTETAVFTLSTPTSMAEGKGRLIHPVLGDFEYECAPDEWDGFDTDVIVPPTWSHATTLTGGADLLWDGSMRDAVIAERWTNAAAMPVEQLRMMVRMWTNPPDPETGTIEWRPNYWTSIAYRVAMTAVTVQGASFTIDSLMRQGWVRGPVEARMRIIGYA